MNEEKRQAEEMPEQKAENGAVTAETEGAEREAGTAAAENAVGAAETGKAAKAKKRFWKGFLIGFFASAGVIAVLAAVTFAILFRVLDSRNSTVQAGVEDTGVIATPSEANPENLDYDRIDSKIRLIQKVIHENYLFDEKAEDVEEGIYHGMADALGDPYTVYYSAGEYEKLTEETSGTYYGIGAVLGQDSETGAMTVVRVFPGSPAEEAGLLAGDELLSVDGQETAGMDLNLLVEQYVRGAEGTKVEMVVLRGEDREQVTLDVTRRAVDIPTVAYEMREGGIGYLQIAMFETATTQQFKDAVDALESQGMKKLIIDLRDNPGGDVAAGVEMLDYMLPDGLLVYTAGRDGVGQKYYATDGHEVDVPTAILVNGNSASCSEIFAGAYRDYGRAAIVGTKTYGKGIVQFVIPLGDGSALKITSAHYYTPKGVDLHKKGIEPDYTVEDDETLETDPPYEKAVEILKSGGKS